MNSIIGDRFDILGIAESKLDSSFPHSQFFREGYKKKYYRLDVKDTSGGLLVYVRLGISSRHLKDFSLPKDIQAIPVELRLKSHKWLIIFIYRPPNTQKLDYFLENISQILDFYNNIERCILIGDFNAEPSDPTLAAFIKSNNLYCHSKAKTCFKTAEGTCIDLILSNQKHSLQNTSTLDTGVSDHHHLIHTELKSKFSRLPPKKVIYRSYNNFIELNFLTDISVQLTKNTVEDYEDFEEIFVKTLDRHAPRKVRLLRGNEKPHMNRGLRKAIMKRTRLRNVYFRTNLLSDKQAYQRQRNYVCNLNRKIRRDYFDSVASTNSSSRHHFWNICKPFFSDKHTVSEKILLIHDDEIISNDSVTAKLFNDYFNDITKGLNLKSWEPDSGEPLTNDPIVDAIAKFSTHPSILKIKEVYGNDSIFKFVETDTESVYNLIMSLNSKKSTSCNINSRILKVSADVCSFVLKNCFNSQLSGSIFHESLKRASITPVYKKKGDSSSIENYRPISILPTVSKVFERIMANQLNSFFESRFLVYFVVLESATAHSMLYYDYYIIGKRLLMIRTS